MIKLLILEMVALFIMGIVSGIILAHHLPSLMRWDVCAILLSVSYLLTALVFIHLARGEKIEK